MPNNALTGGYSDLGEENTPIPVVPPAGTKWAAAKPSLSDIARACAYTLIDDPTTGKQDFAGVCHVTYIGIGGTPLTRKNATTKQIHSQLEDLQDFLRFVANSEAKNSKHFADLGYCLEPFNKISVGNAILNTEALARKYEQEGKPEAAGVIRETIQPLLRQFAAEFNITISEPDKGIV